MTSTLRPAPLAKALELRDRLRAAGVKFVHWKSNDHLAEALAGLTDIDLYVPPSDREAFATAMAGLGAQHIIGQPWSTYPNVEDWLLFDEASGGFLHLHQHFALMTGLKRVKHLAIPWGPMLMENLREDGASGWPIPAAEMEFIILLVRIWAKMPPWRRAFGQRIPGSIRKELDWLRKDSNPETVRALLARLLPGVPPAAVLEVATAENPSKAQIISAARLLNRALINSERLPWGRALGQAAGRNGAMAVRRGLRPLSPRAQVGKTLPVCGVTVAVIGSDGAGKSTVTAALTKWLRFKLDTECLYLGTGDGGSGLFDITRRAVRGAVRAVKPKTDTSAARPTRREGDKRGNRVVALHHLLLLRQKLARLRLARALAADGRMVILDRFPQDQFAGLNDGPRLQEGESYPWAARAEQVLFSKIRDLQPDIVIRLQIDSATAKARKPDHDLAVLERKAAIVSALSFAKSRVLNIDASQPLADVLLTARRAIWQAIRDANP